MHTHFIGKYFHIGKGIWADYSFTIERHLRALRERTPPPQWLQGTKGDVVIIHGFGEVWTHWVTIVSHLNQNGYRVHFINELGRNIDSLENACAVVSTYIEEHNLRNITLISHSKGGIIAKCIIDTQPENIKNSITLAVPYGGTIFGHFRVRHLVEAIPGRLWSVQINKHSVNNKKIYNFYPKFDNHIIPNRHLQLPGAHNKQLEVIGHANIMRAPETLQAIDEILR